MTLRPSDIPASVVKQLNAGTRETANLAESLAMDFRVLLKLVSKELAAQLAKAPLKKADIERVDNTAGVTKRIAQSAQVLAERYEHDDAAPLLCAHMSDTVRSWGCYVICAAPNITLKKALKQLKPLADDPHFGVREWAWLAVRPMIVDAPEEAIDLLTPWTQSPDANIRRFASEATRPRGVWCKHVNTLKEQPERALGLLEPLKDDASKYVQDSVANWLNDAGKTQPAFVRELCARWEEESPTDRTSRIIKRALRNL